jgi:hypothetical protein
MQNGWPNIVESVGKKPLITRDFDYENKVEDPHQN